MSVIEAIQLMPRDATMSRTDLRVLLERDFDAAVTTFRLILDVSKDEFHVALTERLGNGGVGVTRYRRESDRYLAALEAMGLLDKFQALVQIPISWQDLLIERLKCGRGSAIKGQKRGRGLEDFVERIVSGIFGDGGYDTRCRFVGATGTSTEKADFAIPSKEDPSILIEVKGYGATGSKQTDILGDIEKIDAQKRRDTDLLLVLDGVTWMSRKNDLRRLIELQNQGRVMRIYTQQMAPDLEADLRQLRQDHSL